jgi:NADH-quinone oxidoreductase subunit H
MRLGWKVLIPSALAWTLIVATARVYRQLGASPAVYIIGGGIVAVLLALLWSFESAGERAEQVEKEAEERRAAGEEEPAAEPAFPTPPLDLPHYHGIGLATAKPVLTGVTEDAAKEVTGA